MRRFAHLLFFLHRNPPGRSTKLKLAAALLVLFEFLSRPSSSHAVRIATTLAGLVFFHSAKITVVIAVRIDSACKKDTD